MKRTRNMKVLSGVAKFLFLQTVIFLSFTVVAYADPQTLEEAKNQTLTIFQFADGILTAIAMAVFGFLAKYNWSMKGIVENPADVEKYQKKFGRNITGLAGMFIIGALVAFVIQTYK